MFSSLYGITKERQQQLSRANCKHLNIKLHVFMQVQALQPQPCSGVPAHKLPLRETFARVIRTEGVRSLWKGNAVTILHRLPYSAVNFWAYERSNELWNFVVPPSTGQGQPALDMLRRFTAGGVAGLTACAVVSALLRHASHAMYPRVRLHCCKQPLCQSFRMMQQAAKLLHCHRPQLIRQHCFPSRICSSTRTWR